MTKLDCNVVKCSYNQEHSCKRDAIQIMGEGAHYASETCCNSFSQSDCCGCKNDMSQLSKDTDVKCNALECRFNKENHCTAKHIGITGSHADKVSETECASFAI